jgi:AraC-like DNA-binding protein
METALPPRQRYEALAAAANYRVGKMAALCGISIRQLQRDFRRALDDSPRAWLHRQKLQLARSRLLAGDPVKNVALDLGFKHVPNFCEWFKKVNGATATEFVLSHGDANGLDVKP